MSRGPTLQTVEEWQLFRTDVRPGAIEREPIATIYFGNLDAPARARRPLDLAGIARKVFGITVPCKRPRGHDLSTLLANGTEFEERTRRNKARLFVELPPRSREWFFAGIVLALRDRPRTTMLLRPYRPTGVHEKHLDAIRKPAIHEEPGAALGALGHGLR